MYNDRYDGIVVEATARENSHVAVVATSESLGLDEQNISTNNFTQISMVGYATMPGVVRDTSRGRVQRLFAYFVRCNT